MATKLHPDVKLQLKELVEDANEHGLVLFVGAGINGMALPLWNELLTDLLGEAVRDKLETDPLSFQLSNHLTEWCKAHFDVTAQASLAKRILKDEKYQRIIRESLYKSSSEIEAEFKNFCAGRMQDEDSAKKFGFLKATAELCSLPQVRAVATFNFDTLLETAIAACGEKRPRAYYGNVATVPDPKHKRKEIIPIFHLHGLLSPPGGLLESHEESVVLARDEYFSKNTDPLSWETSTPLHLLRHFATLWLGTSLKDTNMMRLLDAARSGRTEGHIYCVQCLSEVKKEWAISPPSPRSDDLEKALQEYVKKWRHFERHSSNFESVAMLFQQALLKTVAVNLIVGGNSFQDIPAIIEKFVTGPLKKLQRSKIGK
jgi:hypothetical protein